MVFDMGKTKALLICLGVGKESSRSVPRHGRKGTGRPQSGRVAPEGLRAGAATAEVVGPARQNTGGLPGWPGDQDSEDTAKKVS